MTGSTVQLREEFTADANIAVESIADLLGSVADGGNSVAAAWRDLKNTIGGELGDFYERLRHLPGSPPLVGDDTAVPQLVAAQMAHLEALFTGTAPAAAHSAADAQAALPPVCHLAAQGWLLMRLVPHLTRRHRLNRRALDRVLTALIARLFEDIIRASAAGQAQMLAQGARAIRSENNLASLRSLAGTVSDVNNVAFDLAHLSRNTRNLSSGAQTIASAAAELVASVEDIARNSEGAANDAAETNRNVLAGRSAVEQVNGAISNIAAAVEETARSVDELSVASEQIGQILTVIESIAGQTNLLALNATIEAARAGEAGRGFAVVASEVKSLATQTSKSTEDITRRIASLREGMGVILSTMERSKSAVVEGQTAISEAASTMTVVADQVGNVSARMQGISDILHQQKGASAEIAASIDKVAAIAGDNHDLLVSMAGHLHNSNARFSENAKAWFVAGSHRSLVEMAKIDHVMFKKRVMEVLMGRDTWPVAEVPDHHTCRLGKWYDAITAADIKALPAYGKLVAPHQRVHAAGIRAIAAYGEGDMDGALAALKDLNGASSEVLAVLDEMSQTLNGRLAYLDAATPRTPAAGAPHSHGGACCGGKP